VSKVRQDHDHGVLTKRAALASVGMALFLLGLKAYASWQTGSVAMLGSLADTALDLLASLVTLYGVRIASTPADQDHRFGHGKAEALAALFQVALITLSAAAIGWRAVERLTEGQRTADAELGMIVSVIAIAATFALLAYQRYVIARTGSVAIRADNVHYQSDLLLNLSVIGALGLDQFLALPAPIRCSELRSRSGSPGAPSKPRAWPSTNLWIGSGRKSRGRVSLRRRPSTRNSGAFTTFARAAADRGISPNSICMSRRA
jgi:Co/Zn/Cd efflux system component